MNRKVAAVFPYDMEFEPVLRHIGLVDLVSVRYLMAPEGCIAQQQVCCGDSTYTVIEHLTEEEMAQVDILWLTDSYYQVPEEVILHKVKEFSTGGKDVLVGRSIKNNMREQVSRICREAGVRFLEPAAFMREYHPAAEEIMAGREQYGESAHLTVERILTPVVVVLGDDEFCDKFELQLAMREQMIEKGYRVCSIGSRTASEPSGVYSHPVFMNENKMSEREKIVYYNNYMKKLEKLEHPDVFILGIPGGILPLSKNKFGDFGVRAYEILQAVTPDFVVMSLHMGEYNRKYLEEMRRLFQYRFNTDIDCFYISNIGMDSFSFHLDTPLKYLVFPRERVREAIDRIEGVPDIYSMQEIEQMGECVVQRLTEYAQVEVM